MAKSLDQLQASKGGSSIESNGFGSQERRQNPAGLYRHEKSGAEVITKWHPLFGSAQADAAVRLGYEFVREATDEELREKFELTLPTPATSTASAASADDVKGILARLNELEAKNTALEAENEALKTEQADDQPKETKKEDK